MTRRPICLLCLIFILFLCLAEGLGISTWGGNPLPEHLKLWIEKHPQATIYGEVERCEDTEFSQSVYLKKAYLIYKSKKISIKNIKAYLKEGTGLTPGSCVILSGTLEEPEEARNPGGFDSPHYYACQHIYYFLTDAKLEKICKEASFLQIQISSLKQRLEEVLQKTGQESGPVFQAMLLGNRTNMDEEQKTKYQMAGILHILAISGLHIGMLGMGGYETLRKTGLGILGAGGISLIFVFQYAVLTGGNVSALRAVTMFLIAVTGKMIGRIYDMMTALSIAAIFMLMECPEYIKSSSFLLSFGAVVGIGILTPIFKEHFAGKRKLFETLCASVSVSLTVLPVTLWFYGEVAVSGIFLNLLVLPTAGIVLLCGLCSGIIGLFCVKAGMLLALPGRGILWIYERLCEFAGKIPYSVWIMGRPKWSQIVIYYALLFGCVLLLSRYGTRKLCKAGVLTGLCLAVLLLWGRKEEGLSITCLDIGQGDCIVLSTEEGEHFLVDGGSSSQKKIAQYQLLPYLKNQGIGKLTGILISHTDADHISGVMELLEQKKKNLTAIQIRYLILPKWSTPPEAWQELKQLALKAGVKVLTAEEGMELKSGKLRFHFLAPQKGSQGADCNEEGMVFQLEYGTFKALFTGDIGEKTEKLLLGELEDIDFLKVSHHGSAYSSGMEFLQKICPEIAVISCSATNRYGHPAEETLKRLQEIGCQIEFTMKNGAITVQTDGESFAVERFLSS